MKPTASAILLVLWLGACGPSGPVAEGANDTAALPDVANVAGAQAAPPPPDGTPPADARPAGTSVPAPAARIPAFLHGRWGLTPADCASPHDDSEGLLIIAETGLKFYESRATPIGNVNSSDTSFSADYSFSGEGQNWRSFETLQLQDKRLVRTTSSPMTSYTYAKCD